MLYGSKIMRDNACRNSKYIYYSDLFFMILNVNRPLRQPAYGDCWSALKPIATL